MRIERQREERKQMKRRGRKKEKRRRREDDEKKTRGRDRDGPTGFSADPDWDGLVKNTLVYCYQHRSVLIPTKIRAFCTLHGVEYGVEYYGVEYCMSNMAILVPGIVYKYIDLFRVRYIYREYL